MKCGVGRRRDSDHVLLWLWHRPVATAPIRPQAWEPPYATGMALKRKEEKKKKKAHVKDFSPFMKDRINETIKVFQGELKELCLYKKKYLYI